MSFHSEASIGARHPVHNWSYASAAVRTAATGFLAADVGKIAYQVDTQTLWALVDESPITWVSLSGSTVPGDLSTVIATGATSTILTDTCRTIVGEYAIEGTGELIIAGTGRLHVSG